MEEDIAAIDALNNVEGDRNSAGPQGNVAVYMRGAMAVGSWDPPNTAAASTSHRLQPVEHSALASYCHPF